MIVKYFYDDNLIYETETNDLSGLITAIEKSDSLHFEREVFKLDGFLLNHYSEGEEWKEELIVYLACF